MINNKFGNKLLNEIKKKKLTPKPKWHFLLKNYMIWGAGFTSLIIGGLAMSIIIYLLRYNDWNIYKQISNSLPGFILLTLPYFWVIFLAIFIFIIYYNFKHTKKGYRYSLPAILIISVISSILLGGLFFQIGLGKTIDNILGERAPFYDRIFNQHIRLWNVPEEGRLSGLVVAEPSVNEIILMDRESKQWQVFLQDARYPAELEIRVGQPIRLIGDQISDNEFLVKEVLLFGPGQGFFRRDGLRPMPNLLRPPGEFYFKENSRLRTGIEFPPLPLDKYPKFKEEFTKDLLEHKDKIQEIIKNNPDFIKHLKELNLDPEVLNQLLEE